MKTVKVTESQFREFVKKTIKEIRGDKFKNMSDEELIALFVKKQMKEMTDTSGLAIKDGDIQPPSVETVNDDISNKTIDDTEEEISLDESKFIIKTIVEKMNDKELNFESCIKIAEEIGKTIPKKYYRILKGSFDKNLDNIIKESKIRDEFQRLVF